MPELDHLLAQGQAELDPEARHEIYAQALHLLRDYPQIIPIRHGVILVAASPNVNGLTLNPTGNHNFSNVWMD